MRRWLALVPFLGAACGKPSEGDAKLLPADAESAPPASASSEPTPPEPLSPDAARDEEHDRPPAGEAARSRVARFDRDPRLAPYAERLTTHFAGRAGPYLVQHTTMQGGRDLALVSLADDSQPMAIASDDGHVDWAKDRPAAGILPPVSYYAIAPHPDGGAVVFAFVPSVDVVAARIWSSDGSPFADLQVMSLDECEALSAAYAPGVGWFVVASRPGGARAQLLRESGVIGWPMEGVEVGVPWRAAAPVTVVVDTPRSVMLFQYATRAGADHVLARAWDFDDVELWHGPVDIGAVPLVKTGEERISAKLEPSGLVRVELPHGALARSVRAAEIAGDGSLRWLSR